MLALELGPYTHPVEVGAEGVAARGDDAPAAQPVPAAGAAVPGVAPTRGRPAHPGEVVEPDRPWIVLVWKRPHQPDVVRDLVFQQLFGHSLEKATQPMLDVHHKGKLSSSGTREQAEPDVFRSTRRAPATMEKGRVAGWPSGAGCPGSRRRRRLRRGSAGWERATCSPTSAPRRKSC